MTSTTDSRSNSPAPGALPSVALRPTPRRIDLRTLDDVRVEMARVYRDMRGGVIDTQRGTRLVYVLSQIGKLVEACQLELQRRQFLPPEPTPEVAALRDMPARELEALVQEIDAVLAKCEEGQAAEHLSSGCP